MPGSERAFNYLLGLSLISWAVLGAYGAISSGESLTIVRICISLINLSVGVLIFLRTPIDRHGSLNHILLSLPSFFFCGLAFKLSPATNTWPLTVQIVFACGTGWSLISLIALGKSFAVLPALRSIVSTGPYKFIRHPAYMGELLMVTGCCLAIKKYYSIPIALGAVFGIVVRIMAEERLLVTSKAFLEYRQQVKWRLIPKIW